jgi:hypothetical protein
MFYFTIVDHLACKLTFLLPASAHNTHTQSQTPREPGVRRVRKKQIHLDAIVPNRSRPLSLIGKKAAAAAGTRRANDHNNNKTACLLSPLAQSIILMTKQRLIYPVPLLCALCAWGIAASQRERERVEKASHV